MILNRRVLNRTTLDRQLLLRRAALSPAEAIERLVAVQAQEIDAPYLGLWTRLAAFTQDDLSSLLYGRQVVRGSLLRGTQHLALAGDYTWIRPLTQVILTRARQASFGRATQGVDLDELAQLTREHLAGRTLTRPQLRDLLLRRWPEADPPALGWSAQAMVPIVHTPPNGIWGRRGATPFRLAEEWLGRPLETAPPVERLVARYLAAYGPASVRDVQRWSGLTRLQEVVEAMPSLRTYQDTDGRVLYDLPDAPLAAEDVPAPVRFLPWFDNLIVAFDDRRRMMTAGQQKAVCVGAVVHPTFLVGGTVGGMWDLRNGVLTIEPFHPLPDDVRGELAGEAARLMAFAGAVQGSITWLPPGDRKPVGPPGSAMA
ncbi:winged helix DNA-binding domain-containing protein [Nonomuraea mesophila]|uniref:Winged helix DNA-binding domain-containing protein n=1 Tax=Nonomuraea mesophila TaxID=2530382 RepID=A0A4R5E6Q1_9ACTN|nr:winged helix DNA-binding domain-containing protein [Nonomuraea mesophila]TDE26501.1 winged helix DNA-binding domain-containing protein [Nonomuraea mesophila]